MFSAGSPLVLPADQRAEEAYSAVFTSPALTEPLEIFGRPQLSLWVDSDAEVITFAARLCDVAPDGSSALVTKGVLNATHRDSHSDPSPLIPGELYELTIDLDATSWLFEPGHRLRLSVSNADFPNSWPSPMLATSRLHLGGERRSRLTLPVLPERANRYLHPISRRRHFRWRMSPGRSRGPGE
jgi:putative CocE/NonD family hydrolase